MNLEKATQILLESAKQEGLRILHADISIRMGKSEYTQDKIVYEANPNEGFRERIGRILSFRSSIPKQIPDDYKVEGNVQFDNGYSAHYENGEWVLYHVY